MGARTRRWGQRAGGALAGTLLALVVAELGANVSHEGAFPYLTSFVADAEYGVRLSPRTEVRVRSRTGRVTTVRTNAEGFRGPEWSPAAPTGERVIVLGDSQAMGLHVEYAETFAGRLASEHAIETLDASVPTWGPPEAVAILRELAPRFAPTRAVLVLNVANDWHEVNAPNIRRTSARDGWAVRPGADGAIDFPGRALLLGRSHLVYATRQLLGRATDVAPLRSDAPHRLVGDLAWLRRAPTGFHSRLGPIVRDARDACAEHGCELTVLVLPLDVQVHAREWAKYRERPVDLRATDVLAAGALADAADLGVSAIDLMPILRANSPGAFLSDDPHLSPSGHAAIADAIAREVRDRHLEARR